MSRFLSDFEIMKKEKQLKEEILLNTSKYKKELKVSIDQESQRINIDSAKKKAVLQQMNYDGFHQMVLGSNLKGTKTAELLDLQPKGIIMNSVMTNKTLSKEIDVQAGNYVVTDFSKEKENVKSIDQDLLNKKELFKDFKKKWKSLTNIKDKIQHLLKCDKFGLMINSDAMEADFFLEVIFIIGTNLISSLEQKLEIEKMSFLLNCLESVLKHSNYSNLKKFIGKKYKSVFIEINEKKEEIFQVEENLSLFNSIIGHIIY